MNTLDISEIQIIPVKPKDGLIAFVSFVANSQFYIGNVAIYTSPSASDGYRLVYPIKVLPNGKEINCVHPINRETGEQVKKSIVAKYQEVMGQFSSI
ncbi:MAG: septation protein SpoVG family protein [Candidatus Omnitrophota bacterium]